MMDGCASARSARAGSKCMRARLRGAVMRTRVGSSGSAESLARWNKASSCSSESRARAASCPPNSVTRICRVLRWNSTSPKWRSSCWIARVTPWGEMPSRAAASRKLDDSAAVQKIRIRSVWFSKQELLGSCRLFHKSEF